jgi:DNA-binding CsgD family transcriptional regulator
MARERTLLDMAHVEMSWIYQADRYPTTDVVTSLSPRQRQTLQYLLAGRSEKEIAEIMLLSRNTVHHHVKALHRHFGVSSRSELLAKWVRSGHMEVS